LNRHPGPGEAPSLRHPVRPHRQPIAGCLTKTLTKNCASVCKRLPWPPRKRGSKATVAVLGLLDSRFLREW